MFKKFGKLLAPFMLAPLSSLLINSPAHASYYWSDWQTCRFSWRDYTAWSARIETRGDGAARPEQIRFGNGNTEQIAEIETWDSWDTGGERRRSESYWEVTDGAISATTKRFYPTWITKRLPRYANVKLYNSDGRECRSEYKF